MTTCDDYFLIGKYCEEYGLSEPTDLCSAGYYCTGGADVATPINHLVNQTHNVTFTGNDVCPTGYYCPNGTQYPLPCPPGTFSINTQVYFLNYRNS